MNRNRRRLLLASLAVLAVACAVLFVRIREAYSDTRLNIATAQLASLQMKIRLFHLDTGVLPHTLQDLLAQNDFKNWQGPYARSQQFVDPWGQEIRYEPIDSSKPSFRLSMVHADGTPLTSIEYPP